MGASVASYPPNPVSEARPVRIARPSPPAREASASPTSSGLAPAVVPPASLNSAATRRAFRLALLFVLVVALAYYLFVVAGTSGPSGASSSEQVDLGLLGVVAAAIAAGGFLLTIFAAPRRVEISPAGWTLERRLAGPREYSFARGMRARRIRSISPGLFAPAAIVYVEITEGRKRRVYWIDEAIVAQADPPVPP